VNYLEELEKEIPLLSSLHLGHTPFQIEFFKTTQQRGCRKFEYWQHLIQIKSLARALEDNLFDLEETKLDLDQMKSWWKLSTARRKLKIRRVEAKIRDLAKSKADRDLECQRHVEIIKRDYSDLLSMSENEILKDEEQYWVNRLSRQLAFNRFAAEKGLSPGDVQAVASLPPQTTQKILQEAHSLLATGVLWSVPELKKLEG